MWGRQRRVWMEQSDNQLLRQMTSLRARLPVAERGGGTCIPAASFNKGGALGGVEGGYNWQINQQLVVGLEADFDWSGIKGTGSSNFLFGSVPPIPSSSMATEEIKWFGTVRGRLGWLPTNNFLLYGTGGLAYGRVTTNTALNTTVAFAGGDGAFDFSCIPAGTCFAGSTSQTLVGWTAGAGGEYAITKNIIVKAEYLYAKSWSRPQCRHSCLECCTTFAVFFYSEFQFGQFQRRPRRCRLEAVAGLNK